MVAAAVTIYRTGLCAAGDLTDADKTDHPSPTTYLDVLTSTMHDIVMAALSPEDDDGTGKVNPVLLAALQSFGCYVIGVVERDPELHRLFFRAARVEHLDLHAGWSKKIHDLQ